MRQEGLAQARAGEIFHPVIARALLLLAVAASAADFPQPWNSEKDPGVPMPAEEAAAKWKVPDGFKVSAWAAEPDVQNPIACAWDPRGRLWVAENYTYADHPLRFDEKLRDRVLIFDGTSGGRFTKRTVFTDDVQHLTSVEVGLGGVWLMAPPRLLFVPDRNGDDVPDGPAEVVLDGFTVARDNYHNFANGLRWGPDGWLYGRCGHSCPGLLGTPGTSGTERIPIRGGIWRFHPQRKVVEVLTTGTTNPWGLDWDSHGEAFFVNTVTGHLWHLIPGAHLVDSNPSINPHVYERVDTIADHWHFDRNGGRQALWDSTADAHGGGHAHIGAMIYLGDNWPAEYRGRLFTWNMHGRRANQEIIERKGSGYVGRHGQDVFLAVDKWFRGLDLTYGPDGGVFVIDWSDTGECHESTGVHRTSGRIYKITYGNPKAPAVTDLTKLSNSELVKLHGHKNEWFVRMARRMLVERAYGGALATHEQRAPVAKLLRDLPANHHRGRETDSNVVITLRTLETLASLGEMDAELRDELLSHPSDHIRAAAIRLGFGWGPLDDLTGRVRAKDEAPGGSGRPNLPWWKPNDLSPRVRLALASALSRLPVSHRRIAEELVADTRDADDHNLPLMIWYGIAPLAESWPDDLVKIAGVCELPTTRRLITRRLCEDVQTNPRPLDDLLAVAANKSAACQADILAGLVEGFTGWRKAPKPASWDAFVAAVPKDDAALQARMRDLSALFGDGRALDEVKRIALDKSVPPDARKAALRTLIDNRPGDLRAICEQLLGERWVNAVAVRGLALFDDPAVGIKLAKSYRAFHPSERALLIAALVSRSGSARALLDEIAAGKIPREDLSTFDARQIRGFNDGALSKRLAEVWGELRDTSADKRALIAKLKTQLTPAALDAADKSAGRVVFESLCATCHTLHGHGGQIGPDLTGSGRANLDYLLENIMDPGAVVPAEYRLNIVTLKDGRVINGMIGAKTGRTITFKTATEPVTVERAEIVKQEEVPVSMMPEGLLLAFSDVQLRDLIAYLMHPGQVALPATARR